MRGDGCAQNKRELHKATAKGRKKGCDLRSSGIPSAPLCGGPPVEPAVSLADGRGGLGLAEEALAALHDEASQYAGFDLLQVVRLGADFGLEEVDVGLIPCLLLRVNKGHGGKTLDLRWQTLARGPYLARRTNGTNPRMLYWYFRCFNQGMMITEGMYF